LPPAVLSVGDEPCVTFDPEVNGMKTLIPLLGLFLTLAVAGCGGGETWQYRSDRDVHRDWWECQKENQYSYTYPGAGGTTTDPADSCMRARGWKKVGER